MASLDNSGKVIMKRVRPRVRLGRRRRRRAENAAEALYAKGLRDVVPDGQVHLPACVRAQLAERFGR